MQKHIENMRNKEMAVSYVCKHMKTDQRVIHIFRKCGKKSQKYKNLPATCVTNVSELKKLQTHENM